MNWLRVLSSRVVGWLKSDAEDREFEDEIQDHLARLTEDHMRRGMDAGEAARLARVRLGGVSQLKEDQRDRRGLPQLDMLWHDARFAMRMFAKNPGFALLAVLTVAVGIAVNTVVFTLINAAALKRLPVADANNLFRLERSFQSGARGDVQYAFSFPETGNWKPETGNGPLVTGSLGPCPSTTTSSTSPLIAHGRCRQRRG